MPSKKLPKTLVAGAGEPPDIITSLFDAAKGEIDEDIHEKRSGQILWIRGLTRLQTQVSRDFHFEFFVSHAINKTLLA